MTEAGKMVFDVATWLVPLAIAIVFHEVAHGRVARLFGDMTAANAGRLSFNPIRHIDPFGTVIVPVLLAISGAPVFGWARPVPVRQSQLKNPRWHMVLVALAGPATNILLAIAGAIAFAGLAMFIPKQGGNLAVEFLFLNLIHFMLINLFLAVFNMLPLPPFDGSKVLAGFLPPRAAMRYQSLDRFALVILLVLLIGLPRIAPQFDIIRLFVLPPVGWLFELLSIPARTISGG